MKGNSLKANPEAIVIYVDMNSFFASCEQQDNPALRGKPVGVCPFDSPTAAVIAPSVEAKKFGVKTGMRLNDCRQLCPGIIPVIARPFRYRWYHIEIMKVLYKYCDDVMAKSIDEAVMNLTAYRLVYKDVKALALQVKEDIKKACGEYVKCSVGIAPNLFLAKLGTELQKPDGLVEITPGNLDDYLKQLHLTDLPGIAENNERRLLTIGIRTPYEMRYASPAILRKAFGGIVGDYWHARLNFKEVDLYQNAYRSMSAGRTISTAQRQSKRSLEGLLNSLCVRLEQRMVKQKVFCKEVSFGMDYKNSSPWQVRIQFTHPLQDAADLRHCIEEKIKEYEKHSNHSVLNDQSLSMSVAINKFIKAEEVSYTLFDNKMKQDKLRTLVYTIKDRFGRDSVRKASETISPDQMADAIGFGSVKDMYGEVTDKNGNSYKEIINKYLLEE